MDGRPSWACSGVGRGVGLRSLGDASVSCGKRSDPCLDLAFGWGEVCGKGLQFASARGSGAPGGQPSGAGDDLSTTNAPFRAVLGCLSTGLSTSWFCVAAHETAFGRRFCFIEARNTRFGEIVIQDKCPSSLR